MCAQWDEVPMITDPCSCDRSQDTEDRPGDWY